MEAERGKPMGRRKQRARKRARKAERECLAASFARSGAVVMIVANVDEVEMAEIEMSEDEVDARKANGTLNEDAARPMAKVTRKVKKEKDEKRTKKEDNQKVVSYMCRVALLRLLLVCAVRMLA